MKKKSSQAKFILCNQSYIIMALLWTVLFETNYYWTRDWKFSRQQNYPLLCANNFHFQEEYLFIFMLIKNTRQPHEKAGWGAWKKILILSFMNTVAAKLKTADSVCLSLVDNWHNKFDIVSEKYYVFSWMKIIALAICLMQQIGTKCRSK